MLTDCYDEELPRVLSSHFEESSIFSWVAEDGGGAGCGGGCEQVRVEKFGLGPTNAF
jgi:hypothetical protein